MTWQITRDPNARPAFPMLAEMVLEPGTAGDWEQLHQFHYKSEGKVAGARYWRVTLGSRLVGVSVMCYPRGLLRDRHKAFPDIKPGGGDTKLTNTYRYKFLNNAFALNARTVNDTLFRGVGIGYRMLNLAARMDWRKWCEIQSSMGRFNQFAHRAGFQFVVPEPPKNKDAAVALYRRWFDANPADQVSLLEELEAMSPVIRERVLRDLRAFYYKHSALEKTGKNRDNGTSRVDAMSPRDLIKNLNQMAFATPLYGVYRNPDFGRELPKQIPLSAFDWQAPDEPLKLENLKCE
jgi:ABC-type ATPase with predicted acetyltransferase domain